MTLQLPDVKRHLSYIIKNKKKELEGIWSVLICTDQVQANTPPNCYPLIL